METNLTTQESFEIIQKMINSAKEKIQKKDAFFYLYWGYIIFISSLVSYFALAFKLFYLKYIWLLPILAIPFSVYKSIQLSKTRYAKTFAGDLISSLWAAFGISLMIFIGAILIFFKEYTFFICPISLLLIAVGIFTTGKAFNFKPLIWGALISWLGALLCFFFNGNEQFLIYSIAIFFGYILPGHLIRGKAHV